jgi:hypothetical protein
MTEIKYKDNFEVTELAGSSIAEARKQYQKGFKLAGKTAAFLNGKKITLANEAATILNDDDRLVFKASSHKLAFLVGALVLAMAITGGIFAYGFTNASTTINATTQNSNFADVTANTTSPVTWTVHGGQKGATGGGTLFDINTLTSGYPGDMVATVTMANTGDLVKIYRSLSLKIEVRDSGNNLVDINADGVANANDYAVLNLNNGSVALSLTQSTPGVYTIKVLSGSYIANTAVPGWTSTSGAPMLYCEIAQR